MSAMQEIESKTCIRFVKRSSQSDYISIVRGKSNSGNEQSCRKANIVDFNIHARYWSHDPLAFPKGCWSYVGRQGGKQDVNLEPGNPGCIHKGVAAHELIHASGFFHEQSRTDRDDYVTIHWDNIQKGEKSIPVRYCSN